MNRAERRAGRWMKFDPKDRDYDAFLAEVGEDAMKIMIFILRTPMGMQESKAAFDDRQVYNSVSELVRVGLLNIWVRWKPDGVEIRPEFLIPGDNDNARARRAS